MFLELTEALKCPNPHNESYMICAPVTMDGRDVVRGGLACPVCRAEFAILDRVVWMAAPSVTVVGVTSAPDSALTAQAVQAFLELQGHGGFVVLAGRAGRLGPELGRLLPGVGIAGVNPPPDVAASASFSIIRSPRAWPVRRHSLRAVVVGADASCEPWLAAAAASLLKGLRIIVEDESATPEGVVELARGAGVFVGERRAR